VRALSVVPRADDAVLLPGDEPRIMITHDAPTRRRPYLSPRTRPLRPGDDEEDDVGTSRRAAGLGLLAYGIGTPLTMALIGSPGGDYNSTDIAQYVSAGHRATAFVMAYVGAFAALGLLAFGHRMREELGELGRTVWGLAVAGAATAVTGWFVVGGVAVAAAEGGAAVQGLAHPVIYLLTEIGNLVAVCGGAFFAGLILLALAARGPLPMPLRVLSGLAGVCGIVAPTYFPMAVFLIGILALAVWCLVSRVRQPQPAPAQTQLV